MLEYRRGGLSHLRRVCVMLAPPGQFSGSSSVCPTKVGGCSSAELPAIHVMSVLSWAAAEHPGSWESVQRFLSTLLLRLTHFPKVKLGRILSPVPLPPYLLPFLLFLFHWICLPCFLFQCITFCNPSLFLPLSFVLSVLVFSFCAFLLFLSFERHLETVLFIQVLTLNLFLQVFQLLLTSSGLNFSWMVWSENRKIQTNPWRTQWAKTLFLELAEAK